MVNTSETIAYAEIVAYVPLCVLTVYVSFRHGFHKQLGWVFLALFCAVRTAAAAIEILSVHNPTSGGDAEWAGILGSVGLSPLLLAAAGLLKRVNDLMREKHTTRILVLQFMHLPCTLGLVLSIVGGMHLASTDTSKHASGKTLSEVGIIILLVVFLILAGVAVLTTFNIHLIPKGDKRLVYALLAFVPLVAVRVCYSILAVFLHNKTFSLTGGNAVVHLCMALVEEFAVVVLFTLAGLTVPVVPKHEYGAVDQPLMYKNDPSFEHTRERSM